MTLCISISNSREKLTVFVSFFNQILNEITNLTCTKLATANNNSHFITSTCCVYRNTIPTETHAYSKYSRNTYQTKRVKLDGKRLSVQVELCIFTYLHYIRRFGYKSQAPCSWQNFFLNLKFFQFFRNLISYSLPFFLPSFVLCILFEYLMLDKKGEFGKKVRNYATRYEYF